MALLLKHLYHGYHWLFEEVADPRPNELGLALMSTPLSPAAISAAYLCFCLSLGPRMMARRRPFDLKNTILVYNVSQIAANVYILLHGLTLLTADSFTCMPVDYSRDPLSLETLRLHHCFFLLKLSDFLDTIFFVLRKKDQQVSFLHIYHHFGMAFIGWVDTKFVGGGHGIWVGLVNCPVHAVMYTYYTLALLDGKWKRNLAFKKFITQAQMVQFLVFIVIYGKLLFMPDCKYPKLLSYGFVPQNVFMFLLFFDFYKRVYTQKKQ